MLNDKDLNLLRITGDQPADDFVNLYFSDPDKKSRLGLALRQLCSNKDWAFFISQIPEASFFDLELGNIISPLKKEINSARKFFLSKEEYILQLLGLLSLPYCYAAADGAKVLYQTERMYKDVHKRLEETAQFVGSIMKKNAFEDDGCGKVQIFKVRVMHAAARFYLKKQNWDNSLGLPVNQEDMAGTNLSFSLIVIRGLRKMGFNISYQDQMDYIKYWSWIGQMLGVKPELLPKNGKEAREIDKIISERQFKASPEGKQLTVSLLNCFYQLNDHKVFNNEEIAAYMRFLLGNKAADIINLPTATFPSSKRRLLKLKSIFS
ncbi:DUF2236 domain-containing protein [Pedobacter sp. SD-b]|uniref:DUF2236 domain-containing protein n=1 Tax=Pedobacter segetis TaxID=2793069 RepID=A0ABS1BIY6_9SPHI|nr:oxygenase MpaB family protein [Pedobacter segetis]MBK0382840.1 DUF2236 domain-containing protein [Pedobacter segetis]